MDIKNRIKTLIQRVIVDRSDDGGQVPEMQIKRFQDRAEVVEEFKPQGLYFRTPADAEGIMVSPGGSSSNAVLLSAQDRDRWPAGGSIEEGEGGLHYLGAFKVFLDKDGIVYLGAPKGDADLTEGVRDDKVQTELARLKSELDAVKDDLDAHRTVYNLHTHGGVTSGGGATAVPATLFAATSVNPATPGETKSTTVKLK